MAAKKKQGKVSVPTDAIGVFFFRLDVLIGRFGPEARVVDVIRAKRAK